MQISCHLCAYFVKNINLKCTVRKFQDFHITQILREINVRDSGSVKSAISTHLVALNFGIHEFLKFLRAEIEIQKLRNYKNGRFLTCAILEIDFM